MISIGYVTCRPEPRWDWFFQSLARLLRPGDDLELILVDYYAQACDDWTQTDVERRGKEVAAAVIDAGLAGRPVRWVPPKPTVWAGPHRLSQVNYWHVAASRNTALCYVRGDYWAMLDDRCVLQNGWMVALREAVAGNYAVCGAYQKRTGITVKNGVIENAGIITGKDSRVAYVKEHRANAVTTPAPGSWFFGCSFGLPTEWALQVNGFAEDYCDGMGAEDTLFGSCLETIRCPILFDRRMAIVEDRTPEYLGPVMKRIDKGKSPQDKSHRVLEVFKGSPTSKNVCDLRALRQRVLAGQPFPPPVGPHTDWYDGQFVSAFA